MAVERAARPKAPPSDPAPADIRNPPAYVDTQAEVADVFHVARRTVQRWMRDGCPGRGERGYDLEAIRTWQATHREPTEPTDAETEEHILQAKARKARADADRAELDVRIRTRQLELLQDGWMSRRQVLAEWHDRVAAARAALLLVPRAAARELVDVRTVAAAAAIVERHVHDILSDLAREDLLERIEAREKALASGAKIGRGRGRPKGARNRRSAE